MLAVQLKRWDLRLFVTCFTAVYWTTVKVPVIYSWKLWRFILPYYNKLVHLRHKLSVKRRARNKNVFLILFAFVCFSL